MAKVKSDRDVLDTGIKALVDALGYAGAVRFLRHFSKGEGDYLVIQQELFKGMIWKRYTRKRNNIMKGTADEPASAMQKSPTLACIRLTRPAL